MYISVIKETLRFLISDSGHSELELARRIKIPPASINKLKTGKIEDPQSSTLIAIANYFNISVDQLLGQAPLNRQQRQRVHFVPLLDMDSVLSSNPAELNYRNHSLWIPFESSPDLYGKKLFAFKAISDAMYPSFDENTTVIVDSTMPVTNKKYVLIHVAETGNIILRQAIFDGNTILAVAENKIFPAYTLTQADKILGIVIYSLRQF